MVDIYFLLLRMTAAAAIATMMTTAAIPTYKTVSGPFCGGSTIEGAGVGVRLAVAVGVGVGVGVGVAVGMICGDAEALMAMPPSPEEA